MLVPELEQGNTLRIIDLIRFIVKNRGTKVFKDWPLWMIARECEQTRPFYLFRDEKIVGVCFYFLDPVYERLFIRELLIVEPGRLKDFIEVCGNTFPGYLVLAKRHGKQVNYGYRFTNKKLDTCFKKAKNILISTKQEYPLCEHAKNQGDPSPQSGFDATRDVVAGAANYYPWLSKAITSQILPQEQAIAGATQAVAPTYGQTQTDLFAQLAPTLNYISGLVSRQNALQDQGTQRELLGQGGQDVVGRTMALQRQIDPGYFSTRDLVSSKTNDLLNSINPTSLSGSERAEVERSLNRQNSQSGLLNAPSSLSTVNNAMSFGKALQDKQGRLSQAINSATQTLQPLQSGYNAFNLSTGRLGAPSVGNNFIPQINVPANIGQSAFGLGANLLGQSANASNNSNQLQAQRRSGLDSFNQTLTSVGNAMPSNIS